MNVWEIIWMMLFVVFVCGGFYVHERRIAALEDKMRMAIDAILLLDDGVSLKHTGVLHGDDAGGGVDGQRIAHGFVQSD